MQVGDNYAVKQKVKSACDILSLVSNRVDSYNRKLDGIWVCDEKSGRYKGRQILIELLVEFQLLTNADKDQRKFIAFALTNLTIQYWCKSR